MQSLQIRFSGPRFSIYRRPQSICPTQIPFSGPFKLTNPFSVYQPHPATCAIHSVLPPEPARGITYLGMPGAFSKIVGKVYSPNSLTISCKSAEEELFQMVEEERLILQCYPFLVLGESFAENYKLLLHNNLSVVGEVYIPDMCWLLALPRVELKDLDFVLSDIHSLDQCKLTLQKMGVYEGINVNDASYAAEVVVKLDLRIVGAIASGYAGYPYGLDLLEVWMSDDDDHSKLYSNNMRFLMLAQEAMTPPTDRPIKTTFAIADNRMGREVSYHSGKHTWLMGEK